MPIITMLETKRSPSVGRPGPCGALGAEEIAEPVARHHDLADDLARREIAHQPLRAGVAERAVERAADLAREAKRAAVGLRDIDALDLVRPLARDLAGQAQQPLAGAVDRDLLGHHLRPRQRVMRVEQRAQLLRHAGHLVEALRAAHIEPVPDLLHAHLLLRGRHADRRRAPRPAPRASARPATASPAARSARAGFSRARSRSQALRSCRHRRALRRVPSAIDGLSRAAPPDMPARNAGQRLLALLRDPVERLGNALERERVGGLGALARSWP